MRYWRSGTGLQRRRSCGPAFVRQNSVKPHVVRGGAVGLIGQIAAGPCDPYTCMRMIQGFQVGQGAVIITLAVADAVAVAGKSKCRHQYNVGRRRWLSIRFEDAESPFVHWRIGGPQPE